MKFLLIILFFPLWCFSQIVDIADFKLINNLVIFKARINNFDDTINLIFDTGIYPTLITNLSKSINLDYEKKILIRGLGKEPDFEVFISENNNIFFTKNVSLKNKTLYVFQEDKLHLSEQFGMRIDGLIGYDLLSSYIVFLDYTEKKIKFISRDNFQPEKYSKNWEKVPITLYKGKPYIKATLKNKNKRIEGLFLFDLGASDPLLVFQTVFDNLKSSDTLYYLGQGLSGDIYGYFTQIDTLFLTEKYYFKNIIAAVPDTGYLLIPPGYDPPQRIGSIGAEVFKRFFVIIDYKNKFLYIKPNSYYKKPFFVNTSGIEVKSPIPAIPFYQVFYVYPNSPAYKAGILPNDIILTINGEDVKNLSLNDVYQILNPKVGKKISIKVLREGKVMKFKFVSENFKILSN